MPDQNTQHINDISISEYTDTKNKTHLVSHSVIENEKMNDYKEKIINELFNVFTYKGKHKRVQ